ncbi:MAG TPA: S8 family serine peptidase, partial [Actinomycetota bacterium]|nr:S8 family serine peptidase [Actinomycetota bacterium]
MKTGGGRRRKRGTAAWRRAPTIALILGLAVAVGAPSISAATGGSGPRAQIIVMTAPGATASIESAVEHVGGVVEQRLSIIDGFSAAVPTEVLPTLGGLPGVVSVTADSKMQPQTATYDPSTDVNSMNAVTRYTGAVDWWNTGYTGAGVDVAVIDTGVSPVEGLATPGKVLNGPDLSLESQAPNLRYLDTFGHGTFMAGLIAGHDSALTAPYADAPASAYRGMAPDARIVSLKVGTADGGTDVSQVIAAIDWVVQHAHDPGLNIRVLNLSYGTNSTQLYTIDPLAFAAEQAWKRGIVVVAAGGNSGFQRHMNNEPAIANPAYDPFLLAVGASDSQGTDTLADDLVPAFSPWVNRGATRGVDLVAPGTHLQGLRVPNSYIDANHPEGLLGDRYFRGSGTSQAAAIMSGAAALVLQKYPSATPNQVKQLLTS